jgi:ribosomal protein S10
VRLEFKAQQVQEEFQLLMFKSSQQVEHGQNQLMQKLFRFSFLAQVQVEALEDATRLQEL